MYIYIYIYTYASGNPCIPCMDVSGVALDDPRYLTFKHASNALFAREAKLDDDRFLTLCMCATSFDGACHQWLHCRTRGGNVKEGWGNDRNVCVCAFNEMHSVCPWHGLSFAQTEGYKRLAARGILCKRNFRCCRKC